MLTTSTNLWPEILGGSSIPDPIKILKDQGDILSNVTNGQLYAEVTQSRLPTVDSAVYDFYICVRNKSFRYKLLTVECNILSNYPAKITNQIASSVVQVQNEDYYNEQLRLIFGSDQTTELLGRLLTLAKD